MGDFNDPFMRNQNAAVQARTKVQNRSNVLQLKLVRLFSPIYSYDLPLVCFIALNYRDLLGFYDSNLVVVFRSSSEFRISNESIINKMYGFTKRRLCNLFEKRFMLVLGS